MPTPVPPPLSLCIVSPFYYEDPWCAGPSAYYFNLVRSLCDLGHRVFLIVTEDCAPRSAIPNCEVSVMRNRNLFGDEGTPGLGSIARAARRLLFSWQALREVRRLMQGTNIDAILAPELFAPGLFIALFERNKLFTRIHTPSYIGDSYNRRYRFEWIGRLLNIAEKIQAKRSKGLSVASKHLVRVIEKDWHIPRNRIRIIPNSIQIEWVQGLAANRNAEIPAGYLFYFGRLERRKGVHILSQSLKTVLSAKRDIRILFAGRDCGLKETILRENEEFRDRIVFLGSLEKVRLFGFIRGARLVILPSLFENFSLAGLEAMALGRPVIGTYGTAFEEIIEDGVNGFLVEPGNAGALADKIISCLERSDLEQVGRNAFESVLRFDSLAVAAQKIEFYRETLFPS